MVIKFCSWIKYQVGDKVGKKMAIKDYFNILTNKHKQNHANDAVEVHNTFY